MKNIKYKNKINYFGFRSIVVISIYNTYKQPTATKNDQ